MQATRIVGPATGGGPDERYDFDVCEDDRAAEHHRRVAIAAYYRAEKRGFEPGHDLEDWLAAETEVAVMPEAATDD